MKDDRKTELNRALQAIRQWLSADSIYQRMDYQGEKLKPHEHKTRVSFIRNALTASELISALLKEELERVDERN